jgi:hypothetical protein
LPNNDLFSHEVDVKLYVLGAAMMDRVLREIHG